MTGAGAALRPRGRGAPGQGLPPRWVQSPLPFLPRRPPTLRPHGPRLCPAAAAPLLLFANAPLCARWQRFPLWRLFSSQRASYFLSLFLSQRASCSNSSLRWRTQAATCGCLRPGTLVFLTGTQHRERHSAHGDTGAFNGTQRLSLVYYGNSSGRARHALGCSPPGWQPYPPGLPLQPRLFGVARTACAWRAHSSRNSGCRCPPRRWRHRQPSWPGSLAGGWQRSAEPPGIVLGCLRSLMMEVFSGLIPLGSTGSRRCWMP